MSEQRVPIDLRALAAKQAELAIANMLGSGDPLDLELLLHHAYVAVTWGGRAPDAVSFDQDGSLSTQTFVFTAPPSTQKPEAP